MFGKELTLGEHSRVQIGNAEKLVFGCLFVGGPNTSGVPS